MTAETVREPLSREKVLAAAIAVADTDGLGSVTMRRVAGDLGVEAMSLYHHVRGKEPLLDGVIEALINEIEAAVSARQQDGDDWRTALRQRCLTAREVVVKHRWAPELISSRTAPPPNLMLYFEAILATLINGGFSYHLAHRALHALGSMSLGFAQELFATPADGGDASAATEAEINAMTAVFPHMAAMVAAELHDNAEDPLGWCDSQAEFEFTLDLILDGLARHHRGTFNVASTS